MGDKIELSSYPKFQELLKKGIGDRKIVDFSAQAGLPRTTVSRLINSEAMNRPSITTLKKIASAINYPVYADMLAACGYEMESLPDALDSHYNEVKQAVSDVLCAGNVFLSIDDAMDKLKNVYDKGDSFTAYPGKDMDGRIKAAVIIDKWRFDRYDCKTYFGLIYTEDDEQKITSISVLYGLGEIKAAGIRNQEMKKLSLLSKKENSGYFYEDTMTTVFGIANPMYNDHSKMDEMDRMMAALGIIDKSRDFTSTWAAYGIPYELIMDHGKDYPERIRKIMMENSEYVCTSEQNTAVFKKIEAAQGPMTEDEMNEILEDFHQDGVNSKDLAKNQMDWGPGAVIAQILTGQTGQQFFCYDEAYGLHDGCIAYGRSYTDPVKPSMDTIKAVYEMAKAIGTPTFGMMYHTEHHLKPKNSTYYTDKSHIEYPDDKWMIHLEPVRIS